MFEAKIDRTASNGFSEFLSLFETNLMPNRKAIELLLQLKRAKAHGKIYMKVKPHLDRHLLRNCLLVNKSIVWTAKLKAINCTSAFMLLTSLALR